MQVSDLKIPAKTTASGRSSSITNAFINAALPHMKLTDDEKLETLKYLDIDPTDVRCAYCGDGATEWDHFYPTVRDRRETGWFTERANLVPACGKCNQSKGNKHWRDWIRSDAPLSPQRREMAGLEERIQRLEEFEAKNPLRRIDLSQIRNTERWKEYEALREEVVKKLRIADEMAKVIAVEILAGMSLSGQSEPSAIALVSDEEL